MIRLIKWIFIVFFILGILLGILVTRAIQDNAIVTAPAELSQIEIKRVKQFINENNPGKLASEQITVSRINQRDINLVLNYLVQKAPGDLNQRIAAKLILDRNLTYLQASFRMPEDMFSGYVNVTAKLAVQNTQSSYSLRLKSMTIGGVKLPEQITERVLDYVHKELLKNLPEYKVIGESIQNIYFETKQLTVNYKFDEKSANAIKSQLSSRIVTDDFKQALIIYSEKLATLSHTFKSKTQLTRLVNEMFYYAQKRGEIFDPVIENKAAFVVLGAYMIDKDLRKIFGEYESVDMVFSKIYINKRFDLSQHLLISAAITSMSNSRLAAAIGLDKEIQDSKSGSGFSFADLAADQAGIKLAEYATSSKQNAKKVQMKLAVTATPNDFMPDIKKLPEGLRQYQFKDKFSDVGSASYNEMQQLILYRISRLSIYH